MQVTRNSKWGRLVCLALMSVLLCYAGISRADRLGLVLSSLGTLGWGYIVLLIGRKSLPDSIVWVAFIYIFSYEIAVQVLIGILDIPAESVVFDIYANLPALTLSQICLLTGSLFAALALSGLSPYRSQRVPILKQKPTVRLQIYLIGALVLWSLRTFTQIIPFQALRYLFLVLTADFVTVGFFLGWFSADMGVWGTLSFGILIANGLVSGLNGSRNGLMLVVVYLLGRLVSPRGNNRLHVALFTVVIMFPLMILGGAIGRARAILGRDSLDLINLSTAKTLLDMAMVSGSSGGSTGAQDEILSRLYAWPNAIAVELTPGDVPYRGYWEWISEWKYYINPNLRGDRDEVVNAMVQERAGVFHNNDYGMVNTEGNTGEFGLIADGWSTGGGVGVFLFAFIAVLAFCCAEKAAAYSGISSDGALLLGCILSSVAAIAYAFPLQNTLKEILLATITWITIIKFLDPAMSWYLGSSEKRSQSVAQITGD